ncbi:Brix domain-containing protein [Mucidula mucida]|nr:Brix domain-containing protein [Mucidula mucida]
MLRTVKPKNARSKRVMDARMPKEIEDERTAIFVKGTHTGEVVNKVMKDLMALKRSAAIAFNKKNDIHPFDAASASTSTASLEFWSSKNDASLFLIGQSNKNAPTASLFGVEGCVSMAELKTPKSTPGHKPMLHFASELFSTHPRFIQLKSMLMSFFNGEQVDEICLSGLEHVISVSCAPTPPSLNSTADNASSLPKVHIRAFTTRFSPLLTPMGPSLDLVMRRHEPADEEMLKQAMKRPKLKKKDVESGLGKKRKNLEVDEMGDLRGRVHVGSQD